jgi:2-octaprenyl-6-methoxyphenol hydroxylase
VPDVAIRGAGPVGCALALALKDSRLQVALQGALPVANAPPPSFRPVALSYASRLILERLGVWDAVAVTAIETIVVSQAGHFGRARLDAADASVPALGYVTEYSALLAALRARVEVGTQLQDAQCVVHAEGSGDDMRERRYEQDAIVACVRTRPGARHTAFERFTAEGPLALLPLRDAYALIWSMRPERARQLASSGNEIFLRALAGVAGPALGEPLAVQSLSVQPLMLRVRPRRASGNEVFIGNAAQALHPVAGQGLNLGLRDAWDLARILKETQTVDLAAALSRFAAQRRFDATATIRMTDFLASGFTGNSALLGLARGAALSALDVVAPARRFFARRMIFGASAIP